MKRSLPFLVSSPVLKKFKPSSKTIVTHNGTFHCDESLACFLLHQTKEFRNSKIIRSRDPKIIENGDIVIDVGAVYNPSKYRFDHHQRDFNETMNDDYNIKLSSAGLIYKHFGKEIIENFILEERNECAKDDNNDNLINILYWKIYSDFILEIDAIDNGVNQFDGTTRYSINTSLSHRISRLNPSWNEEISEDKRLDLFYKAMDITGEEFTSILYNYYKNWYPARNIIENSINTRKSVDSSMKIIKLSKFCPWKSHVFDIEKEKQIENQIIYVIFKDSNSTWRIQCVPNRIDSFDNRKSLPESWRGKRDEELSKETGIEGCIFVHSSGFIGGNKTYSGALSMAKKALNL